MQNDAYYIYLVFSKTGTWLSKALKYFQPAKYVHTSIGFDDRFDEMYSFGRIHPRNPFSGGFVKESLYEGVYKNNPSSACQIFRVPVTQEQFDGLKADIEYFYKHKNQYRYNFIGLFGVWFNRPIYRKNHYFCSQFVYVLLRRHHILDVGKTPELVQTVDLMTLENKKLIYEGLIVDYPKKKNTFNQMAQNKS